MSVVATAEPIVDPISDPLRESVGRILAAAREELQMDVAYLTEFSGDAQQVRLTGGDSDRFGLSEGREMPLEGSYCLRMVDGRLESVVADTATNVVVRDLPVTVIANIGAYVGVPVLTAGGDLYGTLCCASAEAHPSLDGRDIAFMHVLARIVGETVDRERTQGRRWERLERSVIESRAATMDSAAGLLSSEAEMVRRLALAVEYRDDETGAHVHRVSRYAARLAVLAGLSADQCELIRRASPLHDAGKVAIPDAVLLKPGRLTPEERAIMETHAQAGHELLRGSDSPVLQCAAILAWTHHEKYGGGGYPRGLVGQEIPIEGQILAIVDVYDALSSDRVYRPAFPSETVEAMMRADSGSHFNPSLLQSFLATAATIEPGPGGRARG